MAHNNITVKLISDESISSDGYIICGYPNEFKQVVVNLLSNAKDAIEERKNGSDTVESTIKITISKDSEYIMVNVQDNGKGVPSELVDRIFEPYYTTKEQGKGTGVGLYMSKVIIENNMNGYLSIKNSDEGGAVFTIKVV
jgi:signal transduction histidine kinase